MKLVYTWVKICMYTYIENQRGALHTHTNTYPNREQHLVQLRGDQYDDGRSNVTQFFVYVQKKEWKSENASEHLLVSIWWAIISSLHCVCVCVWIPMAEAIHCFMKTTNKSGKQFIAQNWPKMYADVIGNRLWYGFHCWRDHDMCHLPFFLQLLHQCNVKEVNK